MFTTRHCSEHCSKLKPFNAYSHQKTQAVIGTTCQMKKQRHRLGKAAWSYTGSEQPSWGLDSRGLAADSGSLSQSLPHLSSVSCMKRMCQEAAWWANQSALHCRVPNGSTCGRFFILVCVLSCFSRVWLFATLLCPWDSPGKNAGLGCCALLQRVFPTQGLNHVS